MSDNSKELIKIIEELRKGLIYELSQHCGNAQGRQYMFADFLRMELDKMRDILAKLDSAPPKYRNYIEWAGGEAKNYERIPKAEREAFIHKLQSRLNEIFAYGNQLSEYATTGLHLNSDITTLKGIGPSLGKILLTLGIHTVRDALHYYPASYLDRKTITPINQLRADINVVIVAKVLNYLEIFPTDNLKIIKVSVKDNTGIIDCLWFQRIKKGSRGFGYRTDLSEGREVMLAGKTKYDKYSPKLTLHNVHYQVLDQGIMESLSMGRITPIYRLTAGLPLNTFRRIMDSALRFMPINFLDYLNKDVRDKYSLMGLRKAVANIHFPEDEYNREQARKRLAFDELLFIQLALGLRRQKYQSIEKQYRLTKQTDLIDRFIKSLPFELTADQNTVINEIYADIASDKPMMRLLQGDVGSGKTIVALITLLLAVDNGLQGAFMAPTDVLAFQHYDRMIKYLHPFGIRVGYLSSSLTAKEKRDVLDKLATHQIDIIVGTHALFQEKVNFSHLAIIVVDEQHRFGVEQRGMLRAKGANPEILNMTATPIPRTLAFTIHGDLDISVITQPPKGRFSIETKLIRGSSRGAMYNTVKKEIDKGRQAYIVYPLIEESETSTKKSLMEAYNELSSSVFEGYSVGVLHGQMNKADKAAVMDKFVKGEIQILMATTVIEVGVDVANASIMVIENANYFGISQLHQLRGRVGRGEYQSYCYLVADTSDLESMVRLEIVESTTDGFRLAQEDLRIRGQGDFIGVRQSGVPGLRISNLITDEELMNSARATAHELVEQGLSDDIKKELNIRFRDNPTFLEG